ncbi:MAG: glycosyltransferase family 4 protein [Burkholderiaceae bacterium]|nr:glycosyltransferase family 4 protein [Rhodoferax sp.]MCP5272948.1 glycosyltransferase family 4 protein [Burkholderiaceae bacterium]
MTPPVCINGKFALQRITGVQRVAHEIVRALDALPAADGWTLLCPPGAVLPRFERIRVRTVGPAGWPLHAWEQVVLPWAARRGLLVNLAGGAPALARWQIAVIHDAAVFDHPEAYTPAFVRWYSALFRHLVRRGDTLMTVSAFSQQRLAAALGVPPVRFGRLPLGADHMRHTAPDLRMLEAHGLLRTPYVLAVGSANPTKNLAALVRAWARLPAGAQRLVIAGGRHGAVFADTPGADPAGVLRLGAVDDAALVALYRHAQVLVFPSVYEGFGLPPLEAMAVGCPVLAARAASLPEVCGDAVAYLSGLDDMAIAADLQRLLADAGLRDRLRAAGPAQAARWTWAAAAEALVAQVSAVRAAQARIGPA